MAAGRSRRIAVGAASIAVHLALLAVVAVQAPRLIVPPGASGPPEAVIPILILPRVPPPAASAGTQPQPPQEIRLHRRKQAFANEPPPVAPLVAPVVQAPKPSGPPPIGPRVLTLPSQEDAVAANARNALRGALGCANAKAIGLSREERQKCEDQLAVGAKSADFPGLGINADKASGLAAAAAKRERDAKYRDAAPVGVPTPPGGRWDSQRSPPGGASNLPGGSSAAGVAAGAGSDKPTLVIPF